MPIFKELLRADRCSVFMIDPERSHLRTFLTDGTTEIVIPVTQGVVGYVASTGKALNIPDAYLDDRFDTT